ncbi:hypothetical protein [Escherichia coli]
MNGFRNSSRNGQVWRWQRAGSRAVILEVSGRWMDAAEAWRRAAGVAPRTDWRQFARKALLQIVGGDKLIIPFC